MEFGVCGTGDLAAIAARSAYDYMEGTVGAVLKPSDTEEAFRTAFADLNGSGLRYPIVNIFIPGAMKITGPDADMSVLQEYVTTVMRRAEYAGIEIIVFGSGSARQIPEGFDRQKAHDQLVAFCRMVGPIARKHGVTVVVEPLCRRDCNVLNTVKECAALVTEVGHPGIRLLVDSYHMMLDNDPFEDIVPYGHLLAHVHIATAPNRCVPGGEACDLEPFFRALAEAHYTGRVSIEGKFEDPEVDLPLGLATMRDYKDAVFATA